MNELTLPNPPFRLALRLGVALSAVVLVVRLWVIIPRFSPTTDEPAHLGAAVAMVEAHKAIATVSHPPLSRWLMAAVLWRDGARLPMCRGVSVVGSEDLGYALGTHLLYAEGLPYAALLNHVRRAMLVFPLLSLLFLFLLTRLLAGERAACLATIFFSLDPSLLGHGIWACDDVAACAGFLASLYTVYRWLDRPTAGRAAAAGLAIGLAISLKFSCLFMLSVLPIIGCLNRKRLPTAFTTVALHTALAGCVALTSLWATYAFNVDSLGKQNIFGHPSAWDNLPGWVLHTPVPMPSFVLGVARLLAQNSAGIQSYLNGEVGTAGWWHYFPELLLIKSPLGFLTLLAVASVLWLLMRKSLRRRAGIGFGVPLLVITAFTLTSHYDLGIRYLLPAIALLYGVVAWQLSRGRWIVLLGIGIFASAVESALAHPDYLAFFNGMSGGTGGGAVYALDSNLDWNQDLYRLADSLRAHPGLRPYSLRLTSQRNAPLLQNLGLDSQALGRPVHGTYLFISKDARLILNKFPWLDRHAPIATVGVSIDVYDLRGDARPGEAEDVPRPDDPREIFGGRGG